MITSTSTDVRYKINFQSELHQGGADTTEDKGGCNSGFRPHDLLEASLASCMNMWIKMYADNHDIPLSRAKVSVQLDRSQPEETIFNYSIEVQGELSKLQSEELLSIAETCPVRRTLSKAISFEKTNSNL